MEDGDEIVRLMASLKEMCLPGEYMGNAAAVRKLRRQAEWHIAEHHANGWPQDRERFPDYDALRALLHAMSMWTAAMRAEPTTPASARCPCNPTSIEGRAWFDRRIWLPFLEKLELSCRRAGLEAIRGAARRLVIELAEGQRRYDTVALGPALLKLLAPASHQASPRGRKPLTPSERADKFARCVDQALANPLHAKDGWVRLDELKSYGMQNPHHGWSTETQEALRHLGYAVERTPAGHRHWRIRRLSG